MTIQLIHSDYWTQKIQERRAVRVEAARTNLTEVCHRYTKSNAWVRFWNYGNLDHLIEMNEAQKAVTKAENFYLGLELALNADNVGVIEIDDKDIVAIIGSI